MATIKAPISTIQDAADKLKRYTEENEDLFAQILNMVNGVESCGDWKGKSMKTLQQVTKKNQKKYEQGMQELFELGDFLQRYADAMEKKDAGLEARIKKIAGG